MAVIRYLIVVCVLIASVQLDVLRKACQLVSFPGGDTPVCECSPSYCDWFDSAPDHPFTMYDGLVQIHTNKAGDRVNITMGQFHQNCTGPIPAEPLPEDAPWVNITINRNITYQTIAGYGAALTDSAARLIQGLKPIQHYLFMRQFFGEFGLEYKFVRIPIGGSEFSSRPYTYLDYAPDANLDYFSLQREDIEFKIPIMKVMKELSAKFRPIEFISTLWSPPAWMKQGDTIYGNDPLKPDDFQLLADYYVKFIQAYAQEDLKINYTTLVNQPSQNSERINGLSLSPDDEIKLLKLLAPTLEAANISAKILFNDDLAKDSTPRIKKFLDDPEAMKLVSGVALQAYGEDFDSASDYNQIRTLVGDDVPIYSTQYSIPSGVDAGQQITLGNWTRAAEYADMMIDILLAGGVSFFDQNLALDLEGGPSWAGVASDAPILINGTTQTFYKQPQFYTMSQITKFTNVGCVRIDASLNEPGNNKVVAFITPLERVTIVITNPNDFEQVVNITDPLKGWSTRILSPNSVNTMIYKMEVAHRPVGEILDTL